MRTVTVTRKRTILKPAAYYYVYCDGKLAASVYNGASASFEIDENAHLIYFEIQAPIRNGRGGTARSNVLPIPAGDKPVELTAYRNVRVFCLEFSRGQSDTDQN